MFFNAVIFDLDNTLYNYNVCHEAGLKSVSEKLLMNFSDFEYVYNDVSKQLKYELNYTASSHNRFIYFKLILEKLNIIFCSVKEINDIYWQSYFDNMILFDNVLKLLIFFKSKNKKIALLTDLTIEIQYKKLEHLDILNYFDVIITSEEVGIEKPSIKGFQYCLNKLNETSDKVIMIGDNLDKDINGAKNCNIYGFWFDKASINILFTKYAQFNNFNYLVKLFKTIDKELDKFTNLCKYTGERFDLTQGGGGNISFKLENLMFIKSSGYELSNINYNSGYTIINNSNFKNNIKFGDLDITESSLTKNRASMETYMHSYLNKYVVHLHPIQVNKILIKNDAKNIIKELFPDSIFIEYVTPGIELSKSIFEKVKIDNNNKIIFLQNHGIIISVENYSDIIHILELILIKCENYLKINFENYKFVNNISNIMKIYCGKKYVSYLSEDLVINNYINNLNFKSVFPDKVIFCGINYLDLDSIDDEDYLPDLIIEKDYNIIKKNSNIYITSTSLNKCREIETILKAHILMVNFNYNINYLDKNEEFKLLNLDSEKYRKNVHST